MARALDEITEAEIEAAADVMLTPIAAPDPGTKHKWRAMKDEDIIAHQEVGDLVARMIRAAELARETVDDTDEIDARIAEEAYSIVRGGMPSTSFGDFVHWDELPQGWRDALQFAVAHARIYERMALQKSRPE